MTRRTAAQALIAVIVGALDQGQTSSSSTLRLPEWTPGDLIIGLHWKSITVTRGGKSVTIDQDELFAALESKR